MEKITVFVKSVYIGDDVFDGKTIQEVKEYLDRVNNDYIDMLYQGCIARFSFYRDHGDEEHSLHLVFERQETDLEYKTRMEKVQKDIEYYKRLKYEEYLKLKKEFENTSNKLE
jgi:hypoxanthine phosphoribosyltransferase